MKRALALFALLAACGGKKPASQDHANDFVPEAEAKKAVSCRGTDLDLLATLIQSACEVPNPKPDAKLLESKGLEITITPPQPHVEPGGTIELTVTYKNTSDDDLPLEFALDPEPRFAVETYDASEAKRADMPKGAPPKLPADMQERTTNTGTARVTLEPKGVAKVKVRWTASKLRWAPEKVKGSVPERGYPKAPAGPLAKGKYVLHIVSPLINFKDGENQEVTAPKIAVLVAHEK